MFELQCYSDVYNYCWVGKLQEICQGRETRGGHQQDREKKTENAFVCWLGWLTWLENNNRPSFSPTNPLPWFIGYNIIDSHWRRVWNTCLACCHCLCLHSTFTARGVLFLVYSLPCCKPYCFSSWHQFFSSHLTQGGEEKGNCTVLGDHESLRLCKLWHSAWCRKLTPHFCLQFSFRECGFCSFLVFCLHTVLKLKGIRRINFHTWYRNPNRRS